MMDIEKIQAVATDAVLNVFTPESQPSRYAFAEAISKAVAAAFEEYERQKI